MGQLVPLLALPLAGSEDRRDREGLERERHRRVLQGESYGTGEDRDERFVGSEVVDSDVGDGPREGRSDELAARGGWLADGDADERGRG